MHLLTFLSVSPYTYLFCLFIASCQHLLPNSLLSCNCSFYLIYHHTVFWFFPPTFTEPHTSLALSTIARSICFYVCLILLSPSYLLLFPSRDLPYPPISVLYSAATLHLSSFHITHLLLKQFPTSFHILIYLPSKLFVYFPFALMYALLTFLFSSHYASIHLSFASSSLAGNPFYSLPLKRPSISLYVMMFP